MTWNPDMRVRADVTLTIYGVTDADIDAVYRTLNDMSADEDGPNAGRHISIVEQSRELMDDGRVG